MPSPSPSLPWRAALLALALSLLPAGKADDWSSRWKADHPVWRGVHLSLRSPADARTLEAELPALAERGVNVLIAEVNYHFDYATHPELRDQAFLTIDQARQLTTACREKGIRLIPQFNCLGHQSWAKSTFPLLTKYPDLDETPGQYPENRDIYCRSWCPQNPRVLEIVLPMIDELLTAFSADAFHAGMDEVFLLASEHCPRCRGGDPAKLFAKVVNDLHQHLTGKRGADLLIWGDRLLDSQKTGYGRWEAADNGTPPAIDLIPRDVILCDWHYEPLDRYPGRPTDYSSIPYLLEKGFRVWPCGWKNVESTRALVASARQHRTDRLLGHLCSTWGAVKIGDLAEWPPLDAGLGPWRSQGPSESR